MQSAVAFPCFLPLHFPLTASPFRSDSVEPGSVQFIGGVLFSTWAFAAIKVVYESTPYFKAVLDAWVATGLFLATLGASIALYRNSPLHP